MTFFIQNHCRCNLECPDLCLETQFESIKNILGGFVFNTHEMQPPIFALLVNLLVRALQRVHCPQSSPVGLYSIYWVGPQFPEKNLQIGLIMCNYMLRFPPSAAFVVHWAAFRPSKAPVLISICCVLKLTPVDKAHCFTHAWSLTSVIMLHGLCFCCWRWTYGHLFEKWKHRTFWCLNKKKKKPDTVIFLTMRGSFVKVIWGH